MLPTFVEAMGLWLKRLVKDQGGWIDKPAAPRLQAKPQTLKPKTLNQASETPYRGTYT